MQGGNNWNYKRIRRGKNDKRGSLSATLRQYIKNHINQPECFVQPLQKITSGMKSILLPTLSYFLTPQNIERKQEHRKLFKLVRRSSITPRQTGKEVVTVRAVLHSLKTTENKYVW